MSSVPTGWEAVLGLETHCQLATRSKLFCSCPTGFGAEPNAHTCPVCTGQPGALPVLNAGALALGVRAALALGCDVDRASTFDRKNYFYCDLPKGYQITQYARPFATGGGLDLAGGRRLRLTRIHLEEDAGKAIHDRGRSTLVDLNRAGVPLIEIVTEPDLATPEEAAEALALLREALVWAGVTDGDMEKGSLRFDVNVSVRRPGAPLGTRVELKNLNSFRHVAEAARHEVLRQVALLEEGGAVRQETRLFDEAAGVTRAMRTKEDEDDYRYFPEPDLPPAACDEALLERERAALHEPAAARRARWTRELGLGEYDAGVLTGERATAELFEATLEVAGRGAAKRVANWISNEVLGALADETVPASSLAELALEPRDLAAVIALVDEGTVSTTGGKRVLRELLVRGGDPRALVRELGLEQVSDTTEIEGWCRAALEERPEVAEKVRAGNAKALGALVGPVMKASRGRANPELVQRTLQRLIEGSDGTP